jgi:hypothetical protein
MRETRQTIEALHELNASPPPSPRPHLWDEDALLGIEWRKVYRLPDYTLRHHFHARCRATPTPERDDVNLRSRSSPLVMIRHREPLT